jgi:hypothetical protein
MSYLLFLPAINHSLARLGRHTSVICSVIKKRRCIPVSDFLSFFRRRTLNLDKSEKKPMRESTNRKKNTIPLSTHTAHIYRNCNKIKDKRWSNEMVLRIMSINVNIIISLHFEEKYRQTKFRYLKLVTTLKWWSDIQLKQEIMLCNMKLELLTTAHNDASIHEGSSTTLKDFRSIRNPKRQANVPK